MRLADPKAAQSFKQRMTARFQVGGEEFRSAQFSLVHFKLHSSLQLSLSISNYLSPSTFCIFSLRLWLIGLVFVNNFSHSLLINFSSINFSISFFPPSRVIHFHYPWILSSFFRFFCLPPGFNSISILLLAIVISNFHQNILILILLIIIIIIIIVLAIVAVVVIAYSLVVVFVFPQFSLQLCIIMGAKESSDMTLFVCSMVIYKYIHTYTHTRTHTHSLTRPYA